MKAVLIDFDDTLMATRKSRVAALIKAAADFGRHVTPDDIEEHWGKPFNQLILGIVPGLDYQGFHRHYAGVMRSIPPEALPGARDLLAELSNRHVHVFVISSGSRGLVRQDLEDAGLWRYVSRLWGFEDTAHHKPDPRTLGPVLQTLAEQEIEVDQAVYIGDSIADLHVATARGLTFCAVLTGTNTREEFRSMALPDDMIVDSLEELLDPRSWLRRALV